MKTAKQIFEERIASQEKAVINGTFKFDDETQEEFDAKIARYTKSVCVGVGNARDIPNINDICPYCNGGEVRYGNYMVSRRKVDQLDNVYVRRAS